MPVGRRQAGIDTRRPRAVLHQAVADEAELRLLARPLAIEPGIGIGGRGVRLVRPLPAVEVRLALRPPPAGGSSEPSFGRKLFIDAHASISVPSTEKCSLERSFFTRGCASTAARNFAAMSPSSSRSRFFEKHRVVPGRIVHPDPDEPAEQQVVFQPLHQLPLRADRVERLQQHRPQAASPAGSTAARSAHRAPRSHAPAPTAPRSRSPGSPAADDPRRTRASRST